MKEFDKKINAILMEYAVSPDNRHVGSGLGGNMQHFGYIQGRKSVITSDVTDVEFKDKEILWNPDFLTKNIGDVRIRLDEVIAARIKEENFTFPIKQIENGSRNYKLSIDESIVDDRVKNSDPEKLLQGESDLPDLTTLDTGNRMCLCMRVCAKFAEHLDNDPEVNKKFNNFYNIISKFEDGISLFCVRTQIQIERLVNHNLDEDSVLGPYFRKLSSSF